MPDDRLSLRAVRRRRVKRVLIAAGLLASFGAWWNAEQRRQSAREEIRWLRDRLTDRRDQVQRQREEMAEVASVVERVVRSTGGLVDRAAKARELAHMEESHEPDSGFVPVSATRDGSSGVPSEDGARALEQLSFLDGQVNAALDSISVLTALLQERPPGESRDTPSLWPVHGLITSAFGSRPSPYDGTREMHPGIDIRAHYGMPVGAAGDGEVIFAGRDSGYGRLVVVSHGSDLDTFYGHLSALYVREGQRIRAGQTIGAVGASGRATGAHLHFEVRLRNSPVDPTRYLN